MVIFNLRFRRIGLAVLLVNSCGSVWAGGGSVWAANGRDGSVSAAAGRIHVIPEPVSVTEKPGSFYLRQGATLAVEGDSMAGIAGWLVGQVREQTGILLKEEKGG